MNVNQETLNNIDSISKITSGALGIGGGTLILGVSGATATYTGVGAIFLSTYSLTRGVDSYFDNIITSKATDFFCYASGNC